MIILCILWARDPGKNCPSKRPVLSCAGHRVTDRVLYLSVRLGHRPIADCTRPSAWTRLRLESPTLYPLLSVSHYRTAQYQPIILSCVASCIGECLGQQVNNVSWIYSEYLKCLNLNMRQHNFDGTIFLNESVCSKGGGYFNRRYSHPSTRAVIAKYTTSGWWRRRGYPSAPLGRRPFGTSIRYSTIIVTLLIY